MLNITLGADPEFGLLKRGQLAFPSNISARMEGTSGTFRSDGCGRIAEISPPPAINPTKLVANIYTVLRNGLRDNPQTIDYKWKAGSMASCEPIGGHIHIGHPMFLTQESDTVREKDRNTRCLRVVNALDKIVAPIGALIEDPIEAADRRLSSAYGGFQNWRNQPWGFEYRPLASWLTSPKVANGLISMIYAVVSDFDNPDFIMACKKLPSVDEHDYKVVNRNNLLAQLEYTIPFLRSTSRYEEVKIYIEYILLLVKHGYTWGANNDMKKTWNLVPAEVTV